MTLWSLTLFLFGAIIYVELDDIKSVEEKIHCNICNIDIDTTSLEEHLSTSVHAFHKSNFEKMLRIIRIDELYKPTDSVISYWKKSNA